MKKTLIALAVLAVSGAAFAQSTATISGSINAGVVNSGAAGDTASVQSLGGGANAINITTTEDLGGGMRAGFTGQIRFSSASGDRASAGNGNALFHEANVYLTSGMGTVRVGKMAELNNCAFDAWGCTGGAGMVGGIGVNRNGGGLVATQALQNAVSFATPVLNGFSGTYQTSVSQAAGTTTSAAAGGTVVGRATERTILTLAYAKGPLAAQVIRTDGVLNTGADYPSIAGTTDNPALRIADGAGEGQTVSASYDFGVAKVNVFNTVTKGATGLTTNDITSVNASVPMGAYTLLAGYAKDKKVAANLDTKFAVGVNYALSKRTTLGADVFKAEAAVIAGTNQTAGAAAGTGFALRARHTF